MKFRKQLEERYGIHQYPESFEMMKKAIIETFKKKQPTIEYSDEGIIINDLIDEKMTTEFEFALQILLEEINGDLYS